MDNETVIVTLEYHVMAEGAADAVRQVADLVGRGLGWARPELGTYPIAVQIECGQEYTRLPTDPKPS